MYDTAVTSLTARTIRTRVIHSIGGTELGCSGLKDYLEHDGAVVVALRMELDADNSRADDRISTSRERGLTTLGREAWVLQAGVAVVRSVIQNSQSVVKTALINISFNHSYLDICTVEGPHIPAAVQASGVE